MEAREKAARGSRLALIVLVAASALAMVFAQLASAKGGGQIGEAWGTPGTGNGQFFNPRMFGVDPVDGTVYSGDYNGVPATEASNYRIQQLSASGEYKASAEIKRFPESGKIIGLVGIAVDHSLGRIYMVESCRVGVAGGTFNCKTTGGKFAARKIFVYSTTPSGGKLVPDGTTPTISLPEGAQELYTPSAIAVDPSNHDLLLLAEENSGHKVVQRISSTGVLGTRFTDTADKLKPAVGANANSLAVSPSGVAYTITGQSLPGSETTRAWQLPTNLSSVAEVSGFAAAAESEGWPLGHEGKVEVPLGGPQLALSSDGSTLYWKEWKANSEALEAGELLVRGFSLTQSKTVALWGGGSSRCKITTSSAGLAATTGGNLVVFDFGAETAKATDVPAYGGKVMTFGAGGTGCAEPVAKFTINGKKEGEDPAVEPGDTVTFNASSSELFGGFRKELIWKFGDGSEKVVKGATEEEEASVSVTHQYTSAGKPTVKLEIKLDKSPFGSPPAAERTFTVGTPVSGFNLTVTKSGTGAGTVTSTPVGINCGGDCEEEYEGGTEVELSQVATAGSKFVKWTGACSGTGTCKVTMSAAKSVGAEFSLEPHQLTVAKSGTGSGTVTSAPAGINCGATCSANFAHGTVVTLTQVAASGSEFKGWTGACTGTGTCEVTIDAAKSVGAEFTLEQHLLTVTRSGSGAGTVTSAPAGISCGAECSASFNHGIEVTLTPAVGGGSEFKGWTGACTGTGTCKVTMSAAKSVDAKFDLTPGQKLLKVKKAGSGSGTVTSAPAGINCGVTCESAFAEGAAVTLKGAPSADTKAVVWSGCDEIVGANECKVTMIAAKEVTATFALEQHQLTVTKSGTGSGTVTSAPAGINCGATCAASFDHGTEVTLTPAAASGSEFKGWTGACTGTGACKVTVDAAKSVDAKFDPVVTPPVETPVVVTPPVVTPPAAAPPPAAKGPSAAEKKKKALKKCKKLKGKAKAKCVKKAKSSAKARPLEDRLSRWWR